MQKTDLSKEQKHYYRSKPAPELVTIPAANYLALEGSGAPSTALFTAKIKALYAAAYNIKKISKLQGHDFKMPALEGLWWVPGGKQLTEAPKEEWHWKLLIQLPAFVTVNDCKQAIALAGNRKLPYLHEFAFDRCPATLAVQLLHTGSYHEETPSLQKLYGYIAQHELEASGPHREVYITDPGKTPAERLKTILRVDVKPV